MMGIADNQLEKEYPKLGDDDNNNDEEYKQQRGKHWDKPKGHDGSVIALPANANNP